MVLSTKLLNSFFQMLLSTITSSYHSLLVEFPYGTLPTSMYFQRLRALVGCSHTPYSHSKSQLDAERQQQRGAIPYQYLQREEDFSAPCHAYADSLSKYEHVKDTLY
ncbi:hypothetical protein BDA99DRAFT_594302 [Phascolomyces articulosus]|uniref:Uncharacterized protein n=1 Tax=Phascolomyces articulosus TaxID=60185 RepID=A0AAD5JWZ5_9FUNG|nr:hypothetical protein BDA99DRAFT_594302 [Phascolomyces articulosus]